MHVQAHLERQKGSHGRWVPRVDQREHLDTADLEVVARLIQQFAVVGVHAVARDLERARRAAQARQRRRVEGLRTEDAVAAQGPAVGQRA